MSLSFCAPRCSLPLLLRSLPQLPVGSYELSLAKWAPRAPSLLALEKEFGPCAPPTTQLLGDLGSVSAIEFGIAMDKWLSLNRRLHVFQLNADRGSRLLLTPLPHIAS
jgi:hypothetical protein